jgi:hypothetical protein
MKNNTNYFSHDCNAREDEKILQLRWKYKWEWYGIWRLVVEKLSEATNYKLLLTNKWVISDLYLANKEVIEYLFEIWLLIEDGISFWSPSLLKRMEMKNGIKIAQSEWGKDGMKKRRWKHRSKAKSDKSLITSKVKESKVKEIKEEDYNNNFVEFWDLYNRKIWDKNDCIRKWNNLKQEERDKIMKILPDWIAQFSDKQYQPHPTTFLNQKRWNDEIKSQKKIFIM